MPGAVAANRCKETTDRTDPTIVCGRENSQTTRGQLFCTFPAPVSLCPAASLLPPALMKPSEDMDMHAPGPVRRRAMLLSPCNAACCGRASDVLKLQARCDDVGGCSKPCGEGAENPRLPGLNAPAWACDASSAVEAAARRSPRIAVAFRPAPDPGGGGTRESLTRR